MKTGWRRRDRAAVALCAMALGAVLATPAEPGEEPAVDAFGGLSVTIARARGFFTVEKLGTRWVFSTPEGNVFWMRGVFNVDGSGSRDDLGDTYDNRILRKYGSRDAWERQTARRLKSWGFNATMEYSTVRLATLPPVDRLPYGIVDRVSWYGLTNQGHYAPAPFKDLIECLTGSAYVGYKDGRLPDLYDPNYRAYSNGRIGAGAQDPQWGPLLNSPWHIGITMDDADDLFGFGPGPEVSAAVQHPHIGWIALAVLPTKTSSQKHGVSYLDPKVHTKYALRDFLRAKYQNIEGLNGAWGSTYTAWDSAGGYGTGPGLLDENGKHSWLGSQEGTLAGASPGVVADLDAFLLHYARRYFSIRAASLRRHLPNRLVFSPSTLNSWGGLSRKQVLQAAGEYVDVLQVGISSQQVLDLTVRYAGDRPIVTWEGVPANPDSALWRYPHPFGQGNLATQQARGRRYAERVKWLFGATSASGTQPVAGIKWWAWMDSWAEKTNWGLVTFLDNAYDGQEARVVRGTDHWGYPTGGEERDYGDLLSDVRGANASVSRWLREQRRD